MIKENVRDAENHHTPKNKFTTYIYGKHPNNKKEYIWRVPDSWDGWMEYVHIGDVIICDTKFGSAPVIISKIETLDKCPVNFKVKKVCSKERISGRSW